MMKRIRCIFLFLLLLFPVFVHAQQTNDKEIVDPAQQLLQQHIIESEQSREAIESSVEILNSSGFLEQCEVESGSEEIGKITVVLLLLMVSLIALAYMLGNFLNSPIIIAFVKNEIPEIGMSIMLLVFINFIITSSSSILGVDIFSMVLEYNLKILTKLAGSAGALMSAFLLLSTAQTLFLPIGTLGKSITLHLGPAIKPLFDGIIITLRIILASYGMWVTHLVLFCIVKKWFFTVFFPIAFLLRMVPLTRGLGNALIAIILAFLIAYPFMFYLDSKIFDDDMKSERWENTSDLILILGNIYKEMGFVEFGFTAFFIFILFMTTGAGALFATIGIGILILSIKQAIKLTFIYSIILPIINIYVTLTFAREIAKHLGTDLNIAPLVRLI